MLNACSARCQLSSTEFEACTIGAAAGPHRCKVSSNSHCQPPHRQNPPPPALRAAPPRLPACQRQADEVLCDTNRQWQRRLAELEEEAQDRMRQADSAWGEWEVAGWSLITLIALLSL